MKYLVLFTIVFTFLTIGILPVFAQYMGNIPNQQPESSYPPGAVLECIGPQGACPDQRLAKQIENDHDNAMLILVISIPSFGAMIGLIIYWRKRK